MTPPTGFASLRGVNRRAVVLGAVVAVVAGLVFSRFGIDDGLNRDEAIYAYGGVQLAHGVPMYVSIFDPKTPLAAMIAGLAAAVARAFGVNQLDSIRITFLVLACVTVVVIHVLAARLFGTWLAGLAAAAVFLTHRGWALDALAGPDAKTPGILFVVVSLLFALSRRWAWAAAFAALGFLVWQPLLLYVPVVVAVAVGWSEPGRRRRALLSTSLAAAAPVAAVIVYFAAVGALGKLYQATVYFPFFGLKRAKTTIADNIATFATVLHDWYGVTGVVVFVLGTLGLLAVSAARIVRLRRAAWRDPLVVLVLPTFLLMVAYTAHDFQGYPDVYPLLPYPPLGIAGVVGAVSRRVPARFGRAVAAAVVTGCVALAAGSYVRFYGDHYDEHTLRTQLGSACALNRMLGPKGVLVSLGDPNPLVLTGRRDPSRFIYLDSNVAAWHAEQLGGLAAWEHELRSYHPDVVVVRSWFGQLRPVLQAWLGTLYRRGYIGQVQVFLGPNARARALSQGVSVTSSPTAYAMTAAGQRLMTGCSS